jgi:hypothetical protein
VDSLVSGQERHASGRASHRGHGGHRGGLRVARRKALWWTAWLLGGKDTHRGEHRTEVMGGHKAGLSLHRGRLFGWTAWLPGGKNAYPVDDLW